MHHARAPTVGRHDGTLYQLLRKVVSSNQRDWKTRLPHFLLAHRASTHDTTRLTPAGMVSGRELLLPSDLMVGAPPAKERPTIDHAADLVDHLHDTHNYAPNMCSWPVTGWKLDEINWPTARVTKSANSVALSSNSYKSGEEKAPNLLGELGPLGLGPGTLR
jgi:hypothetical protein